jgi:hypothetical protein
MLRLRASLLKDEIEILDGLIRDPEHCCKIFGCGSKSITTGNDAIGYFGSIGFEEHHAQRAKLIFIMV